MFNNDVEQIQIEENCETNEFDVRWDENVGMNDHLWIKSNGNHRCHLSSCQSNGNQFLRCSICQIQIHCEHFNQMDLQQFHRCRFSFVDENHLEFIEESKKHFWIESTTNRCSTCSNKKKKNGDPLLQCLYCCKSIHRHCLDLNNSQQNFCDFGRFKSLIVRPWWIRRRENEFDIRMSNEIDEEMKRELCPLIILINKKSGGQEGEKVYHQCLRWFNLRQVFLFKSNEDLNRIFHLYRHLENIRLLICGGDGTLGWIFTSLADRFSSGSNPPVAICPLGTGNDLSRVLNWGWTWKSSRLEKTFQRIPSSKSILFDRWIFQIDPINDQQLIEEFLHQHGNSSGCCFNWFPPSIRNDYSLKYSKCLRPQNIHFVNYFSLGLDGSVVLDFHLHRLNNSSSFTSPTKNKILYLNFARSYWKEFLFWKCWNLSSSMKLICDQRDYSSSLRHCQTLLILNIQSYGSGTKPWQGSLISQFNPTTMSCRHRNAFLPSRSDDQYLEVIGLSSFDMTMIHLGCRAQRIVQCQTIQLEFYRSMSIHIDGDPFYLSSPSIIRISHSGQVQLLHNSN